MANEIITTLHPNQDPETDLYPNIKKGCIPNGIVGRNELDRDVNSLLNNIGSMSPKGVYSTLTALQTAYPSGANGVYIVSEDGHWYYWNGTAWTDGGVYLSSIPDDELNPLSENSIQNRTVYEALENKVNCAKNIFNPDATDIETGGYYSGSAVISWIPNANFLESGFMPCKAGDILFTNRGSSSEGQIAVCFYDASKNYVSGLWEWGNYYLTIPNNPNIAYVRFAVSVANRYNFCIFKTNYPIVTDIHISYGHELFYGNIDVAIANNQVKQEFGNSERDVVSQKFITDVSLHKLINVFNPNDSEIKEGGYYAYKGNWVSNASFLESGFIPCKAGDIFVLNRNSSSPYFLETVFYDENKNYVSGLSSWANYYLTIPNNPNIAYVRIPVSQATRLTRAFYKNTTIVTSFYVPYGSDNFVYFMPEKNKIILDDSFITQTTGTDTIKLMSQDAITRAIQEGGTPVNAKAYCYGDSTTYGQTTGGAVSQYNWPKMLGDVSGITVTNNGVGGQGLIKDWNTIYNTYFGSALPSDVNLIVLAWAYNDGSQWENLPYGTVNDETTETILGHYAVLLQRVTSLNPLKRVIYMTGYGTGHSPTSERKTLFDKTYTDVNSQTFTLKQLYDDIEAICNKYGVCCINQTKGSWINLASWSTLITDNIHPTNDGYISYSSFAVAKILSSFNPKVF